MELTHKSVKFTIYSIFMGLRWGLNPRPERKLSHENAGKKYRAQMNVGIMKKDSDVGRRKCCLLWVLSQFILIQISYLYPPYEIIVKVLSLGDLIMRVD